VFFLLRDPISKLPGIGPVLAQKLANLDIFSVEDLIRHYPRRWEDWSQISPLIQAQAGERLTTQAELLTLNQFRSPRSRLHITSGIVQDESGSLRVTWFNQPYIARHLVKNQPYYVSGEVRSFRGHLTIINPTLEPITAAPVHAGRIIPVYPTTAGVSTKIIRRAIKNLIPTIRTLPDYLPAPLRAQHHLIGHAQAVEHIHFPASMKHLQSARHRLGFEELLMVHLGLMLVKSAQAEDRGQPILTPTNFQAQFIKHLDFTLTSGQARAIKDIVEDLARPHPTNRLLLGDVGSGKTVVAAAAISAAAGAGFQTALMAPTEVLANQHYRSIAPLMDALGVSTTLLTGATKLADPQDIASGKIDLVIGTHALIQKDVSFKNLNLVIIDEQHRFGVRQRTRLKNKSHVSPHFLSLSATPIPRTLFLTLFSDLDVSILGELPQGRQPITTLIATDANQDTITNLINTEAQSGHKIFVVTPLIDEDSRATRSSIASEERHLTQLFPDLKIGTLHGRMSADEKMAAMQDIQTDQLDVLLATSVIEVGIDIKQATIIWIKNAERFGLAQLHQLRGRVGRSDLPSYCIVETSSDDPEATERLTAFTKIKDGDKLAEMDLEARGPGSFFSDQQSGFLKLRVAKLTDQKLIKTTRSAAEHLLATDPQLKLHPELKNQLNLTHITHGE